MRASPGYPVPSMSDDTVDDRDIRLGSLALRAKLVNPDQLRRVLALQAASHASETVTIPVKATTEMARGFTWLELTCRDENGVPFYEHSIRLQPARAVASLAALAAQLPRGSLTLEETPESVTIAHPGFRLTLTRATGEATLRDATGATLATGLLPHAGRRLTEGEFVRAKKENPFSSSSAPSASSVVKSSLVLATLAAPWRLGGSRLSYLACYEVSNV